MTLKQEDNILSNFLQSLGPWSTYVVIGGGYAPIIYKLYMSDLKKGHPPLITHDLDTIIPRKMHAVSKKKYCQASSRIWI